MINFTQSFLRHTVCGALAVCLTLLCVRLPAETVLFQNGFIHTISGDTITNGGLLVDGGKISMVYRPGIDMNVLANRVVDLKRQHLYPGMIDLDSSLGLLEIESVRGTQDANEVGDYTPDVLSWIAVNPDSELIAVSRANGVSHVEPAPHGGVVAGMSGLIALDGWTTEQMVVKHPAALHVYWPALGLDTRPKEKFKDASKYKSLEEQSAEHLKRLKSLYQFFEEARAYEKSRNTGGSNFAVNPPWEGMLPVVRGEVPIMVHTESLRQIKSALQWSQSNRFNIVIVGGHDAWRMADELAKAKIPVVYEWVFHQPGRDDESYDINFKAPEILRKAGVKVVFSMGQGNFGAALTKNLPYEAAQAVAFGLPETEALKAITLYPAQLMGMDKRLGSIEPGKDATFFVCDGDILDIRSNVKQMWISGREINLESRHTRLYEKYKNRPLPK